MNIILERIFKNSKPNFDKLRKFGFIQSGNTYCYATEILENQFSLRIKITDTDINTEVVDLATDEPYTLFLVEDANGSFIGSVRTAYEEVLSKIENDCFDKTIFKSSYTQEIIRYVSDTYGDFPEFLWEKSPENAIWRRKDNKKWYGVLLTVSENKLGLPSEEKIEILDLRVKTENIDAVIDGKTIFGGYHMNKKHWATLLLDGSVPLQTIEKMLDESYELAR